MLIINIIVLVLALYFLAVRGRVGYKGLEKIKGFNYAHRGLHSDGVAENSLTAFKKAKEKGFGAEFDVHLLKDGNLAVIHDSSLIRTTGQKGNVEDLSVDDLKNYRLENTNDSIPTFQETLNLFDGQVPLIIELKSDRKNYALLCEKVCEVLKNYKGDYCIESFDPRIVFWLKKNKPHIIRGQLSENYLKRKKKLNVFLKIALSFNLLNFITKPDFVAFRFEDRKTLSNFICQKLFSMQMVGWTLRSKPEQNKAIKENWISIFENFIP